jgi:hypothetical protein
MQRDTKFNYGFLLVSLGLPLVADYFLGRNWAVVVAIVITVVGFFFLLSGHQHREQGEAPPVKTRLRTATLYSVIAAVLGFGTIGIRAVVLKNIATPESPTSDNSLTKQPAITASPSSFPFIMGAPLGDNDSGAWQMLGLTFGPILEDYNCDLKFSDRQREKAKTENSEVVLHVGESPKPNTTFPWFPDNPDHQHYKVEINCPDRSYDEDWEVGRVHGQLRTKLTIDKVYLFGQPETIYSCVDHVSGRIDASTVLQPQDRYVANPDWQPNHRYEFPVVIHPQSVANPGHFFFVLKVQNPGCWKCLQEEESCK